MRRIGRYDPSELSLDRVFSGLRTRANELPHSLAWQLSPLASKNRTRLERFRGKHEGERCFIVANGPSLLLTDLRLLEGEITFGLNRIYLMFQRSTFRPSYYAAVNALVLEQFSEDIRGLDMPKFLNWNRRALYLPADPATMFLKSKVVIRDSFQGDLTRPLVVGGTVTFVALQIAYYMGFKTVILVGLDHKYGESGLPSRVEQRTASLDASHFDPQYFPKGSRWQLPDLFRSEIDFALARAAYEADGREILDATAGGRCPVFRKADFAALF
jgi:hypothetical protein